VDRDELPVGTQYNLLNIFQPIAKHSLGSISIVKVFGSQILRDYKQQISA